MENINLRGTGVAVITPFNSQNQIDEKAFEKIINHLIHGGIEYLVILGTTSEAPTLESDEKDRILDLAVEFTDGRVPLVVGIGGNNTAEVIKSIGKRTLDGYSAILSVGPYYNKPTQKGIYYHYKAISESTPLPIILYNVPARTSCNITAETTLSLAHDFKNIIAVKEASGIMEQCMEIVKGKPENFYVISGDDLLTLPYMAIGMDGVISVAANRFPREMSDMVRHAINGDFNSAIQNHYSLMPAVQMMFAEGNPGGIKALMNQAGLCENILRLPLYKVSDKLFESLSKLKI